MASDEKEALLKNSHGYGTTENNLTKGRKKNASDHLPIRKAPFSSLFRYSTTFDRFLLVVGSIFAIINGAGWPLLALVFGDMTNTFLQQSTSGLGFLPESNMSSASSMLNWQPSSGLTSFLESNTSLAAAVLSTQYTATELPRTTAPPLSNTSFSLVNPINLNTSTVENTNDSSVMLLDIGPESVDSYIRNSSESHSRNGTTPEELKDIFSTVSSTFLRNLLSVTSLSQEEPLSPFDSIPRDEFEGFMTTYALYYVYIGLAVCVASFIQVICWEIACVRQIYRLRQEFFYQLLRQEIGWFDAHQSGELAMKLNDDIERVREGIGDKCAMFIQYTSTFVSGFVVGFFVGWELTLVIMAMTPLLALSSAFLGKLVATSASREQQKYAVAGGIAEEVLSSIRTVIAFNAQWQEVKRYVEALDNGKQIALRKYVFMSTGLGFTFFVLYGTYALAFWYGSLLILAEKMDPGSVFTVFFAVMIGSFSLGNAVPHLTSIATAKGSAALVFEVIDSVPDIDPYSNRGARPASFKSDIEFRNVSFTYPARKTIQILKNLNLKIKEGQTVALCGSSGSGKSTIVNLLLRFYDPSNGRITIGGFDLKSLNLSWLRSVTGVVSQEPVLFNCTIAQNIEYGQKGATFPDIVRAAKMANAHDFIVSLPEGYDTMVGERGSQLSGGQKQRIAIARALVKDPRILLLDEATSALDAESEAIVQEALDKARQGRTTIVVAHRLSTIKDADLIYVMEHGRVVEEGTHEELMDKEGVYHQLVTNQVFVDESGYSTAEMDPVAVKEQRRRRSSSVRPGKPSIHASERDLHRLFSDTKEEEAEIPSGWKILKKCAPEWKYLFFGSIAATIVGGSLPVFAIFYSEMFQTFTLVGDELKESAFFWSMMFLVLAVVSFIGHLFRTLKFAHAGEHLTMRLRQEVFTNLLRLQVSWFDDDNHSTGKITTRLATDVPMVKSAAGHRIGTALTAVVTMVTSLVLAFIFGWKLALALLISVPILLASGAIQMKVQKGNQKRDAELMEDAGTIASEATENIRTVQALDQQRTFYEDFVMNLYDPYVENKKNAYVYALAFGFSQGIIFFVYAAAFKFGGYLVANGEMDAVNVYRVFFAMAFSAVSVGQWSSYLPDYTKARLSAGLILKLINTEPEIDNYSKGGVRPEIKGEITFTDVHFRYPNRKTVRVLRGFNLNVKPGQTVALIGPSGCGKSTAVSLILRFYDPNRGVVKVDGFDIRTMNLGYLRKHIAIVSQEPVLFNCSIRDNITYGLEEEVSDQDVKNAARLANAHDFINMMPQGYDTLVGEKGTQLSGGQKQRIAIARALVRDPKILLLDEATSALDTESEKIVQAALDKAREGRTCIVVAHRLSTIQNADCIVVLDQGRVSEQGTHDELLAKKGLYFRLTKKQRIKQ